MKVLVAHVNYRLRGGEESVVENETRILEGRGHEVRRLLVSSEQLDSLPWIDRMSVVLSPMDHRYGRQRMLECVSGIEVVHCHNMFPLLGVGAARQAREAGCAVVKTLHNWRMSCLAGTQLLGGKPCTLCGPGDYSAGIARGCYRGSRLMSAAMARHCKSEWLAMTGGTYDLVLAVNEAIRSRCIGAGMDSSRILVKDNSVDDSGVIVQSGRDGAVFVGRLSQEKGIEGLVRAWPAAACSLTVVGAGPLRNRLESIAGSNVAFTGLLAHDEARELIASAAVLILPSLSDEGPPIALLEALAAGTPAVAFDGAAVGSVVRQLSPDCVVNRGDYDALVAAACHYVPYRPMEGARAKDLHDARFSHERNADALESAYEQALFIRRGH